MYEKLSGMTGTADTEAYEFQEIYGLETVVIPTHRMMIRDDQQDKVYRTAKEKYKAIVDDVKECYGRVSRCLSVRPRSKTPSLSATC